MSTNSPVSVALSARSTDSNAPLRRAVTAPTALGAGRNELAEVGTGKTAISQQAVQALVLRAQQGDQSAFAQLYDLYSKKIHSYLRYHLNGRSELAEDLASDVFLKALEKIHSYQFSGVPFSAWLYRIAHNHLIDYLRALPKKTGVSLDECKKTGVSLDECSGVDDPSAEKALDGTLTHHELTGALEGLTEEQRQVIVLRFMEDKSIADTARVMRKNEDAIKQLQVRALRNMRRTLVAA
jgi:RNA polymerase sigma-70 factor (ECF subfamily)